MAQSWPFLYKGYMIKLRHVSIAALMAAGLMATAPLSMAQTTTQTDQSEEDWRNSQKKPGSDDIFEDIRNNRSTGAGNVLTGPPNPLDSLPEESRRHLVNERAKALATGDLNNIENTPYTPSEAAKSDERLARQEEQVWKEIIGGGQGGQQGQQGQQGNQAGQQGQQGGQAGQQGQQAGQQGGQGSQAGQQGQQGQDGSAQQRTPQGIRGGSSNTVADILAGIKGRGFNPNGVPGGTSPTGSPNGVPGGTSPTGSPNGVPGGTSPTGSPNGVPGGTGQGTSPQGTQAGGGQSSQGKQGQGQQGSSQQAGNQQGQGQQGQSQQGQRGGSANSISDILAGIQGQGSSSGQQDQGQQQGTGQQGQSQQGSSQQAGNQSGQSQQGQGQRGSSQQAGNQSGQSQQGQGQQGQQGDASQQASTPPPAGPLERLRERERIESSGGGQQTSAFELIRALGGGNRGSNPETE